MDPAKVDILFVQFAYGGNGGVPMVLPTHSTWFSKTLKEIQTCDRIGRAAMITLSDTPIPMTRNRAVQAAREGGFDMIFMIDSDNVPDCEIPRDPRATPFWDASFDFAYNRLMRGVPTIICAPYCGPPPHENVYVFFWEQDENSPHAAFRLAPYSRDTASVMGGIQEIAAGPTGMTLYTTKAFDLMDPPYFYYEYKDKFETEKASTEDVTNFRDLSLNGVAKHGEPVLFCNWDAWAGHTKVKQVNKPYPMLASDVSERFRASMSRHWDHDDRRIVIDYTDKLPDPVDDVNAEEPEESWSDSYRAPTDDSNENGVVTRKRVIFDRPVKTIGHQTPIHELEALRDLVQLTAQEHHGTSLRVVEVGSWVGESAIALANGLSDVDGGVIYCIDDFSGGRSDPIRQAVDLLGSDAIRLQFVENCGDMLGEAIRLRDGSSVEIAEDLDAQDAHIIFLDASHDYDSVMLDIAAWLPHVHQDGYLCGHDYHDAWPGVIKAVNDTFLDKVTIRQLTGTTIWVISKREYMSA